MSSKAAETNYPAADGGVTFNQGSGSYSSDENRFETAYDPFLGVRIKRAIAEYAVSSFSTNIQSARLVITVTEVGGVPSNYAYNIYAYTNADGAIHTADYGQASTYAGYVCSNVTPAVNQKFTNDVTAAVMNAITSGCSYVGFRIQPHVDPSVGYTFRFVDGTNGNGPQLLLEFTTPSVNNNSGASDVATNTATLNGILTSTGAAPAIVTVCWGPTDGETNFSGWTNVVPLGQRSAGAFVTNISGLTTSTPYYYRCYASNSYGSTWANATTNFTTLSIGPPGALQLASSNYSVNEQAGSVTVTVTRVDGTNGVATVNYAAANGTAMAGTNYTATNGTLSWASGESGGKTIAVAILNDGIYGSDKSFTVALSNASVASLASPGTATVTIAENSPGALQFSSAAASVNEDAGSVTLTVTRAGGSNGIATVHYATRDGTALAGSNYTAVSGTLSWSHQDNANKTFSVTILDNSLNEADKLFSVELSAATGASLGTAGTATVTIVENDPAPTPPPAAPTGLAASKGTFADKIRITWNASAGATSYTVYRNTVDDSGSATALEPDLTLTNCDDSAIVVNTTYYYWVKAKNSAGASGFSAGASGYAYLETEPVVIPLTADFDGDGLSDPAAVVTNAAWHIWLSSAGYRHAGPYTFRGDSNAVPVATDFDGDGKADPAMMTPASESWTIWLSSAGYGPGGPYSFGTSAQDTPVPGDFDGDGKADPAVDADGQWTIWLSGAGYGKAGPFVFTAAENEIPVSGDFDGDGKADPAVCADGQWTIWLSGAGYGKAGPFVFTSTGEESAAPGDFDGDGKTDPAVCTPDHAWYIWLSASGYAKAGPYVFSPE